MVDRSEYAGRWVVEVAADMCDDPDTVPALTSWVEGKSWALRHRAALTTLDAIEKDHRSSALSPPRRVKLTLKAASEQDVCESGTSVTCCRCRQRAPRDGPLPKRWLQSPCVVGHRHHPV